MFAKSTVVLSIVGALITAHYVYSAKVAYADYLKRFDEKVLEYKHTRCFLPYNTWTAADSYDLSKEIVQRWFYNASTKTCRPLYSLPTLNYTIDYPNYNLPRTREECEFLCSDYCVVNYAGGKTELGVCTHLGLNSTLFPESCKSVLPETHPKQCPPKYAKCCPRDYDRLKAVVI